MLNRQSEQIETLKSEIDKLTLECQKKDELINSVEPMRREMTETINEQQRLKQEYQKLIQELKTMKNIIDEEVYKKRWWLIKFLLK